MARTNWLDKDGDFSAIQERAQHLESFIAALADGVIEPGELADQHHRVIAAMQAVEPMLNDDQHGKVTDLLVEFTAYTIMQTLRELQAARVRGTFGG